MQVFKGSDRDPRPETAPIFSGEVARAALTGETDSAHLRIGLVRFSAGARTTWHTHEGEQALIITEGRGVVANQALEHLVVPGDVALIPPGERHWHGATETTAMAHLSIITPGGTTVLDPVTEIRTKG